MTDADIEQFEKEIAPQLDVFIFQPDRGIAFEDKFTSFAMVQHLRPDCLWVSYPMIYMSVYAPFFNYPLPELGKTPFEYIDFAVVAQFLKGVPAEQAAAQIARIELDDSMIEELINQSIESVEARETGEMGQVDVLISPFIRENLRKQKLFHTINHPGLAVMSQDGRGRARPTARARGARPPVRRRTVRGPPQSDPPADPPLDPEGVRTRRRTRSSSTSRTSYPNSRRSTRPTRIWPKSTAKCSRSLCDTRPPCGRGSRLSASALRSVPHRGKQHDFTDPVPAGEQHHQTVDADAQVRRSAACRARAPAGTLRRTAASPRRPRRPSAPAPRSARAGPAGRSAREKALPNSMPSAKTSKRSTRPGLLRCSLANGESSTG